MADAGHPGAAEHDRVDVGGVDARRREAGPAGVDRELVEGALGAVDPAPAPQLWAVGHLELFGHLGGEVAYRRVVGFEFAEHIVRSGQVHRHRSSLPGQCGVGLGVGQRVGGEAERAVVEDLVGGAHHGAQRGAGQARAEADAAYTGGAELFDGEHGSGQDIDRPADGLAHRVTASRSGSPGA